MTPRISIITVNFNNKEGLARTFDSVLAQRYTDYEHIIIDAGSDDGSKALIEEYADKNHNVSYWVSEPDKGIYNGMNKGIAHACGTYLLFLNSGDYLQKESLGKAATGLTGEDLVYGNIYFVSPEGKKRLQKFPSPPFDIATLLSPMFYLPHPGTFIKRELMERLLYSEQYRIVSDWEFWLKAIIFEQCTVKYIDLCISNFCEGGVSSDAQAISQEKENVLDRMFPPLVREGLQELSAVQTSLLYPEVLRTVDDRKSQRTIRRFIRLYRSIRLLLPKAFRRS